MFEIRVFEGREVIHSGSFLGEGGSQIMMKNIKKKSTLSFKLVD